MTEKRFKMSVARTKTTGIILEHELSTDEVYNLLMDYKEENEQLKQQLNYIQNSISEHIKHQKTELGQKALKGIIEDYNEWLLGHKELKD